MAAINPYLTFDNNCEEVFIFYKSVFGGEFISMVRFKDMPDQQQNTKEADKIMHVALPVGKGTILMGSDTPDSMGKTIQGTNFAIAIHADSKEDADRLFNGLSAGGKVTMPMSDAPWGDYFGMFTDKFRIQWMVSFPMGKV